MILTGWKKRRQPYPSHRKQTYYYSKVHKILYEYYIRLPYDLQTALHICNQQRDQNRECNLSNTTKHVRAKSKSILCYAAPVWCTAMDIAHYAPIIEKVWMRAVIRAIAGYRTISRDAADVIGGQLPIKYEIKFRDICHKARTSNEHSDVNSIRDIITRTCQESIWCTNTSWTKTLMPDLHPWINTNFYLTQALSGHGSFNSYLYRFKLANSETCEICPIPVYH